MEEKKVPALRFRGFDNAWEQRRLGELADKVTEKNTLLAKTEVLTNSAEFGIINQREFFDHDIVNENNIGGYYIVRERDFVYNPRISVSAPVGPINCNKLGKSGVMSPLYTVFRVHDIDSVYLEYFFKTSRWHSFMRFNGDSGVRSDRFSIKTELFYKMPIPITKYCEQVKIGKYFSQLDHLISLHQRKHFSIVMLNTIIQIIEIICLCCFSLFYGVDYNYKMVRNYCCQEGMGVKFEKEADFEEAVIDLLLKYGWSNGNETGSREKNVIKYPTEEDLIQNWADILYKNNSERSRLNGVKLNKDEMQQIIDQIKIATPYAINGIIKGKSVTIKRTNEEDRENFGKEISLNIYDPKKVRAGESRYQVVQQPKFS